MVSPSTPRVTAVWPVWALCEGPEKDRRSWGECQKETAWRQKYTRRGLESSLLPEGYGWPGVCSGADGNAGATEAAMDTLSLYYKVIGFILLMPWTLLGLTLVGYLRSRLGRRAR